MNQKDKSFSKQSSILLLVLALVAVGLLYYFLIYRPTTERIAALQSQQAQVQVELDALNTKAELLTKMEAELPLLRVSNKPAAPYDNSKPVMKALNNIIMAPSLEFSITFAVDLSEEDATIVRRYVNIDFMCDSYAKAKQIIDNLTNAAFRCQINSISLTSDTQGTETGKTGDLNAGAIQGNVSIIFFEAA